MDTFESLLEEVKDTRTRMIELLRSQIPEEGQPIAPVKMEVFGDQFFVHVLAKTQAEGFYDMSNNIPVSYTYECIPVESLLLLMINLLRR